MIQHVAELNRILINAKSLSLKGQTVEISLLIAQCKSNAIEGRMPDHERSIDFSIELGLLKKHGRKKVGLTENGETFLKFNPDELYDLTNRQKKFLLRFCYLDGKYGRQVKDCLRRFVLSKKSGSFFWSFVDGEPFGVFEWIVPHIEQLGVLRQTNEGYFVQKAYLDTVSVFVNEPKGFTEEQLMKWLAEKKQLGNFAEDLVLNFERQRLRKLGFEVEASCVRLVGKLKSNAGYDIESFDGISRNMLFDRFIEVKGSGDPKLRFLWSPNEIKVAEALGDKYWIYFQGGIDKKTGRSKYNPITIQNPFRAIPADTRLTKVENGIVVSGPIIGSLI